MFKVISDKWLSDWVIEWLGDSEFWSKIGKAKFFFEEFGFYLRKKVSGGCYGFLFVKIKLKSNDLLALWLGQMAKAASWSCIFVNCLRTVNALKQQK